mgnify:CR=1 FL=1
MGDIFIRVKDISFRNKTSCFVFVRILDINHLNAPFLLFVCGNRHNVA